MQILSQVAMQTKELVFSKEFGRLGDYVIGVCVRLFLGISLWKLRENGK